METLLTPPVNRTDHKYDLATGDILVRSAMSQIANAMLARFKVSNIAYGRQTVNIFDSMLNNKTS